MLKYEMTDELANFIVNAIQRTQIAGEDGARLVLMALDTFRNPVNKDELLAKVGKQAEPVKPEEPVKETK